MSRRTDRELIDALADEGFSPPDCTREVASRIADMRDRIAELQGRLDAIDPNRNLEPYEPLCWPYKETS